MMKKNIVKLLSIAVLAACGGSAEVEPEHSGSQLASSDEYHEESSMDYVNVGDEPGQRTDKDMGKSSTAVVYGGFSDWDLDGDQELTLVEFKKGTEKHQTFRDWDADGNGEIVDKEYQTALFNAWDTNGDQIVDSYEFRDNSSHWVGRDVTYGTFADWDLDGDMEIVEAEFDKGVEKYHFFESYDADENGEINDLEYQTALFNAWDLDGDQRIDLVEYRW